MAGIKAVTGIYERTEEHGRNISKALTGHIVSQETRAKISAVRKKRIKEGRITVVFQKGHKTNMGKHFPAEKYPNHAWRGKILTDKHKENIRLGNVGKHVGEKNPCWKGGLSSIRDKIYASPEFKLWRTKVFERDNYTCQKCGLRGGLLQAHHKKPFSLYPKLRFNVSNGETLCKKCHTKTPTHGNFLKRNQSYQYMEILK